MLPKLGYWNMRAFAQPIRLLLAFAGVPFEEIRYNFNMNDFERCEWFDEKFTLGLDFPNIPYYIDDDVKLSQSLAILKYLGRKYGMAPLNEIENIRIDLIEAEALDLRQRWVTICMVKNLDEFERNKPEYCKNLGMKLKEISVFLGNRNYFAGNHITYIDFLMFELLDINSHLEPTILDDVPSLRAFHSRIKELPAIAAYMKSGKFLAYPLNAPFAAFGGQ